MEQYKETFERYYQAVERALAQVLPAEDCPQKTVLDAMNYSLMGGGKRIRGVLVLAFYELCGGKAEDALPFACAIEMVHAYSLIHDDLPCMDDDDMRRGRPSCHIRYGEAMALLAGDGLLTHAFETALKGERITPALTLRAVKELAQAAGAYGMLGGQVIDVEHEGQAIDAQLLDTLDLLKTGAMIRVSARIGCIAAGAEEAVISRADRYARDIGLAFQIVDDILDVTSTTERLGKPVHSDEENQKTTYVTLYGVERSREIARQLKDDACAAIEGTVLDSPFLRRLAEALTDREF